MKIRLTRQLLVKLLGTKGIRLPMASTILRFKNSHIYQIIDQRAYRLINKDKLKLPRNIDKQIELYLNYLTKMKKICKQKNIPFYKADRILYELDKR
jgi:thermostable 8-oxoguanine DNA glycosylase